MVFFGWFILMNPDPETYQRIADLIHSDQSPVGIDAKKTHIIIIDLLQKIEQRLDSLEVRIDTIESNP